MQNEPNYCDENCPLEHLDTDVRVAVQEIQEEINTLVTNINRCLEQVQKDIKRVNRLPKEMERYRIMSTKPADKALEKKQAG